MTIEDNDNEHHGQKKSRDGSKARTMQGLENGSGKKLTYQFKCFEQRWSVSACVVVVVAA